MNHPTPFDILGPLPTDASTTVLEASAGTGKTYTVGALVARYVAEGVTTLDRMLVITFGRAASQELRERVRDQLVAAERALADPASVDPSDALLTHLVSDDVPPWPGSTARPSPPPTSSASSCCARSGSRATPTRVPSWSRASTTWWWR